MKVKYLSTIKKMKQSSLNISKIFVVLMFMTATALSLKNNGLYITELTVCGLIVALTFLHVKNKNINN